MSFNVTIDQRQYYYIPENVKKCICLFIPHHTPLYFKINLQNNHTSGDRYKVIRFSQAVADTLTFHFHATLTYPMLPLITRCH